MDVDYKATGGSTEPWKASQQWHSCALCRCCQLWPWECLGEVEQWPVLVESTLSSCGHSDMLSVRPSYSTPDTGGPEDLVTINKECPFWTDHLPGGSLTWCSVWIAFGLGIFCLPAGPRQDTVQNNFTKRASWTPFLRAGLRARQAVTIGGLLNAMLELEETLETNFFF